jgi:hypothetical protein
VAEPRDGFRAVNGELKIAVNQFHKRHYAFALLTLRNAHSTRAFARQILVANVAAHLVVKIAPKMSTFHEPQTPKVDP